MLGACINAGLILIGSGIGTVFSNLSKSRSAPPSDGTQPKPMLQIMGCFLVLIALQTAWSANTGQKFVLMLSCVLISYATSDFLQLESRIEKSVSGLERAFSRAFRRNGPNLSSAFVYASLLFCVGPMAILGAFEGGTKHEQSILISKGMIDGVISASLAGTLGAGTALSALPVLLYEGSLALFARELQSVLSPAAIDAISSTGGMLLLFTGTNLIGVTRIRVVHGLPALVLAGLFANLFWR